MPLALLGQRDCFLGLGGKDDETIKQVFKLTDEQVGKMRNWAAELKYRNEFLEIRADRLLKRNAGSSPEALIKVSTEYRALLDSMQANMKLLDKRLLGLFSDEQYNLYIMLCNQVYRSPLFATRSVGEN